MARILCNLSLLDGVRSAHAFLNSGAKNKQGHALEGSFGKLVKMENSGKCTAATVAGYRRDGACTAEFDSSQGIANCQTNWGASAWAVRPGATSAWCNPHLREGL
jgi:hypothetical protein